jgi:hypothetical protein
MVVLLALVGCQDVSLTESALCDGKLQRSEDYVDSPFDRDGDGYFDANNPGCEYTYPIEQLDCDDVNADMNPGNVEVECNGLDDDCDPSTVDGEDGDLDGFINCDDCNDHDPDIHPDADEIECNGLDDDCTPETGDAPDLDGDGFTTCEECDDGDNRINPDAVEVECNGVDDDCSATTPDAPDLDGDTWSVCDDDCDDDEYYANPGLEEICDDGIDNNCDADIDEDCEVDYTDTWFLDSSVELSCAWGNVEISFSTVAVTHSGVNLLIEAAGTKGQPGRTSGTLSGTSFTTTRSIPGGCKEDYTFDGVFDDRSTFTGTFEARYTGSCGSCSTTSWDLVGTR